MDFDILAVFSLCQQELDLTPLTWDYGLLVLPLRYRYCPQTVNFVCESTQGK